MSSHKDGEATLKLISGLNSIWFSNDHQWVKIFSHYRKQYPEPKYSTLAVIENILSDDLPGLCHESILAPTRYPYLKSDFSATRRYLEEKNLLRLPCVERGGILFDKFPDIFAASSEPAAFHTCGDFHNAFPGRELCDQKQWYLNSINLLCWIFDILPDGDFEKRGVHFYLHQPAKPSTAKFPGGVVVVSDDHFLYFFDGEI